MSFFARRVWRPLKADIISALKDYVDVGKFMAKSWKEKPFLALVRFSIYGVVGYASTQTPSDLDYHSDVHGAAVVVNELSAFVRRKSSYDYVQNIMTMDQHKRLHYTWLGPVAFITQSEFGDDCSTYESNYSATWWKRLKTVRSRIVDVGAFHRWYVLEKSMENFDIPEEYDSKQNEDLVYDGFLDNQDRDNSIYNSKPEALDGSELDHKDANGK
eukprot:m.24907 g.24907  ORF g.24907 m.24907 type:complete len:215 (-) comp5707_c0_seq1:141-785(-)